jgi:hypothetical protein
MRRILIAALLCMLGSTEATAGLIASFSGNTQPLITTSTGTTTGFINFAVFDRSGGTIGDSYDTGNPGANALLLAAGLHTTDSFLYLFQAVNTGDDIASASVSVLRANVLSDGALTSLSFAQVTGGSAATSFLGPLAASPGNISPAVTGATTTEAMTRTAPGTVAPSLLTLNANSLVATFSPSFDGLGTMSTIFGYTSDFAPAFGNGSLQDSGIAANGVVPTAAVPEPSSLVMAAIGAACLTWYGRRRKRDVASAARPH